MKMNVWQVAFAFALTSAVPILDRSVDFAYAQKSDADSEQAVRKSHAAWFDALLAEDIATLEQLLARDVTLAFPGGNLMPRAEFLLNLKSGELFYDTAEHEETSVRTYGAAGIVTGRSTLGYRFKGKPGVERLRYTAVYVRTDTTWRLMAWHSTIRRE